MKRLFFILGLAVSIGLSAQITELTHNTYGSQVKDRENTNFNNLQDSLDAVAAALGGASGSYDTTYLYGTKLDGMSDSILVNNTMLQDSLGRFLAASYLNEAKDNDEEAIQMAINAAEESRVGNNGATVFITNTEIWTFDTQTDTLKSWVRVVCEPFTRFYVPASHTIDALFVNEDGVNLINSGIIGGYYIGSNAGVHDWSVFKGRFNGGYLFGLANYFDDMYIQNGGHAFDIETTGTAYFNSNIFTNMQSWYNKSWLRGKGEDGSGFAANLFDNITVQAGDSAVSAIDTLEGGYNMFTNMMIWDWNQGVNNRKSIIFGPNSVYNTFAGFAVPDSVLDLGTGNIFQQAYGDYTINDLLVKDDATVADDLSVGGDLTVTGAINGDLTSTKYEAVSTSYMVAKGTVTFASEDHDTIINLPAGATIFDMKVRVYTSFNDSGSDLLDIERSDIAGYFLADEDVSSSGWPTLTLSNIPFTNTPRYIVTQYKGENNDATQGEARIYVYYTAQ